ncbi:MAG TPA: hypothetical protein VFI11_06955 [Anaerolineales bacterium]|nr:hypothetical protein [Anaerolineales bacterium]
MTARGLFPLLAISLAATLACGRATPFPTATLEDSTATRAVESAPVPSDYQPIYESLSEALAVWEARLADMEPVAGNTVFGAELPVANGNRGAALLQPATMDGVRVYLDRLQELGVGGVSVAISDPLLWPDYPEADAYAAFFADVADEVRARDMKLLGETGPAFSGTAFSSITFNWESVTLEEYWENRRAQLVRIAREVRPDYLSIGSEPGTEMMLTGFSFSVDEHLAFVREASEAVGQTAGVLVGSGSGTWENPEYARRLANEPSLDFIGLHIYPLSNGIHDYLQRAADAAEVARAAGKRIVLGETWLYKATPEELRRGMDYSEIYARDAYRFWEPLDVRYVRLIAGLSRAWGIEYASFFWSGFFFDYLDYDESLPRLGLPALLQRLNREQADSIAAGSWSGTGRAYQEAIQVVRGE